MSKKKVAAASRPTEAADGSAAVANAPAVTAKSKGEPAPIEIAASVKKKSGGGSFTSSLSLVVALVALAVGVFYHQKSMMPPSSRPAMSEPLGAKPKTMVKPRNVTMLSPSTEMSRGIPDTLQSRIYEGVDQAVLLVLNDDDKVNPTWIYWNGKPKAVAPAGSRSRIESFLGHQFEIRSPQQNITVTMESPFIAYKVNAKDGSIQLMNAKSESEIPELKFPPLSDVQPRSTAKAIKVRNLSGKRFNNYWVPDNGDPPVYQGVIEPNSESTTTSYLTHTFRFTELKNKNKIVFEFSVKPDQELYAYVDEKTADKAKLKSHLEEVAFAEEYKKKHNGRPWLSYYPHEPVKTFMWPADYIGQEYHLRTDHGPDDKPLNFTLKCVSVRPRVFEVDFFLSEDEAKFIIESAKDKLRRSSVEMHGENGELVASDTRTSKNAWLDRGAKGGKLDSIYRRIADLLNVDESTLTHNPPHGAAENMQVVLYKNYAHYAPHHDWGVRGGPHTRLATVLLYLNEPIQGGETAFPTAKVGKPEGLAVTPKRGKAVLFYSQFPDGNVDDESLHEARPVSRGEKWLANVWVHDGFWRREGM